MNKTFFKNNRLNYKELLENKSLVILFSGSIYPKSADQDYPFEVNKNFYYLSGIEQEEVALVILKSNNFYKEMLFIAKHDELQSKWVGTKLSKDEAKEISAIDDIYYLEEFEQLIFELLNSSRKTNYDIVNIYLDLERRNQEAFQSKGLLYAKKLEEKYPELLIKNTYNLIIGLRMIKSEEEIQKIIESIKTTKNALAYVLKELKPSLYEYQVQNYFDAYIKHEANKSNSFDTISAAGKNATILHYTDNNVQLKEGELILLDLGCRTNYYVSDISRTYPVSGKFSLRQRQVYDAVLAVNKACIKYLKPGLTWLELNNYASNLLIEELKTLKLIKKDSELINYYWHSIGHMIGLDTHDPVLQNIAFKPGMVMTIEPGIYIEEESIGIRIEDNILITEDGAINLSKDIIKEVDEIETAMKK